MKKTGVFYHEICGKKAYKIFVYDTGVEEGFMALKRGKLFDEPNIFFYESEPAPDELILKVHTRKMVEEVKQSGYFDTSSYSAGGNIAAFDQVLSGRIDNALVFTGDGGHHSGRDYFGGGCFFNTEAIAVYYARKKFGISKFAIIDTDSHHGNGTMDIFRDDDDLLYICFCNTYNGEFGTGKMSETKICLPHGSSNEEEIKNVKEGIQGRVKEFKPELIYWMSGLDTHVESYGTRCLTEQCYPRLAQIFKDSAEEVCNGNLVAKACCNGPAHVAAFVMPRILDRLAGLDKYHLQGENYD